MKSGTQRVVALLALQARDEEQCLIGDRCLDVVLVHVAVLRFVFSRAPCERCWRRPRRTARSTAQGSRVVCATCEALERCEHRATLNAARSATRRLGATP